MKYKFHKKYKDKYGKLWVRISKHLVIRISDGNIGGWFNGKGLSIN